MKHSVPVLVLLLLLTSSDLVLAQRSAHTELWHEIIRLRQQFQKEKSEILKAKKRLAELKKTRPTSTNEGTRP